MYGIPTANDGAAEVLKIDAGTVYTLLMSLSTCVRGRHFEEWTHGRPRGNAGSGVEAFESHVGVGEAVLGEVNA